MNIVFPRKNKMLMWLLPLFLLGCKTEPGTLEEPLAQLIDSIKQQYAPDKRVALFEIEAESTDQVPVLRGVTNLPVALDALREQLEAQGIAHIDSMELLPSETLKGKIQGLIDISVANIRARPSHSAELVTQATLGMPVKVHQRKGTWYRIQTPDQYLGWVDSGGLELMDQDRFEQWQAT